MGRRKIAIQPISHERNRSATLLKRKNSLFKKAYELGVLCSVDVAILIFNRRPGQKLHQYASSDINDIIDRYYQHDGPIDVRGPSDFPKEMAGQQKGEKTEEAHVESEADAGHSVDMNTVRSKRVRDVEPIDIDTLPSGDSPTNGETGCSSPQLNGPYLPGSIQYIRQNKKLRLDIATPAPRSWTANFDHTLIPSSWPPLSPDPQIWRQSLSSQCSRVDYGDGIVDYPSRSATSSSSNPQYLSPHPSYQHLPFPSITTQSLSDQQHAYPLCRLPSLEPYTPPRALFPEYLPEHHFPLSTDSRSCDTPPDFQEHSSIDSYPHPHGLFNYNVPIVCPSPAGDENMVFTRFMEAIEEEQTRVTKSCAMQNPASGIEVRDDIGHQCHPAMPDMHPNFHTTEAGANWFQVMPQKSHMVHIKEEELESETGSSSSRLAHEPSIFYKPTNISDADGRDIQALTPSHRLRAAASRIDEAYGACLLGYSEVKCTRSNFS